MTRTEMLVQTAREIWRTKTCEGQECEQCPAGYSDQSWCRLFTVGRNLDTGTGPVNDPEFFRKYAEKHSAKGGDIDMSPLEIAKMIASPGSDVKGICASRKYCADCPAKGSKHKKKHCGLVKGGDSSIPEDHPKIRGWFVKWIWTQNPSEQDFAPVDKPPVKIRREPGTINVDMDFVRLERR